MKPMVYSHFIAHLKSLLPIFTLLFSIFSMNTAWACTSPTGVLGSLNYDSGTSTVTRCDGTNWKVLEEHDASGSGTRKRTQVANDTGSCTAIKLGRLRYDGTTTWEYCNGSAWVPFEQAGECASYDASPGKICTDGSIFAGFAANTFEPFFLTRCDAGQTWNGSACTGTRSTYAWGSSGTLRSTSPTNGKANSATLAGFGAGAHPAAHYCENLSIHSKSDWYLPSLAEVSVAWIHRVAIANFTADWYWTSSEFDAPQSYRHHMTIGHQYMDGPKGTAYNLRCARKN